MKASCVEAREILKNLHFPLTKQNVIQQAIKHGAGSNIIEDLQKIPDREYTSFESVIKECEGT
jgi:hypothetical protein